MTDEPRIPSGSFRAIAEELVLAGVTDVVICPGSRSTPLALALRNDPALRCWVHIDERCGGFFALGLARSQRRAVAIVSTSGTAAVNIAPAVVEACYGRVPLIVLTADRPPELRDRGSPQTIDQERLYGRFAKWYAELPVPDGGPATEAHVRGLVARAVAIAEGTPSGPVQLDAPFREPLLPAGPLAGADVPEGAAPRAAHVRAVRGVRTVSGTDLEALVDGLSAARRGVIVCGPLDSPDMATALADLARVSGFPILADGLSNVRCGSHDRSQVIAHHDALLRSLSFRERHRPDLILRFGGTPTSKVLVESLLGDPSQVVVDDGGWDEPTGRPTTMVAADPVLLAGAMATALDGRTGSVEPGWLAAWQAGDAAAARALRSWLDGIDEPFEGAVFPLLTDVLPAGATVLAGNSMPVRDLETFGPSSARALRFIGNRGSNGIDGLVSTALGAAASGQGPVVAVVGDLSFLHDLGGLAAACRLRIDLTIVLIDNDGGGIFSFLPQATTVRPDLGLPQHFEELFGTPHGLDLGPVATALGARHEPGPARPAELGTAVSDGGVRVLHMRTDRARNVELHRAAMGAVAVAVEALV